MQCEKGKYSGICKVKLSHLRAWSPINDIQVVDARLKYHYTRTTAVVGLALFQVSRFLLISRSLFSSIASARSLGISKYMNWLASLSNASSRSLHFT